MRENVRETDDQSLRSTIWWREVSENRKKKKKRKGRYYQINNRRKKIFVVVVVLGLYPWHMEVPRLGVQLELELLAYTTATTTPDPSHVFDLHYTHGNAGSLTHWARPGIKPMSWWILVGFVTTEPPQELLFLISWSRRFHSGAQRTLRPGIEPESSRILVGFVSHWAMTGTPDWCSLKHQRCVSEWAKPKL